MTEQKRPSTEVEQDAVMDRFLSESVMADPVRWLQWLRAKHRLVEQARAEGRQQALDGVEDAIRHDGADFTGYSAEWMRQRILHVILDSFRAGLNAPDAAVRVEYNTGRTHGREEGMREGRQQAVENTLQAVDDAITAKDAPLTPSGYVDLSAVFADVRDRLMGDASESPPTVECAVCGHDHDCSAVRCSHGDAEPGTVNSRDWTGEPTTPTPLPAETPFSVGDASESPPTFDNETAACRHCPTPEVHPRRIGGELTYERDVSESPLPDERSREQKKIDGDRKPFGEASDEVQVKEPDR